MYILPENLEIFQKSEWMSLEEDTTEGKTFFSVVLKMNLHRVKFIQ